MIVTPPRDERTSGSQNQILEQLAEGSGYKEQATCQGDVALRGGVETACRDHGKEEAEGHPAHSYSYCH